MIGIIGAMDEEIKNILEALENKEEKKLAGEIFYSGKILDKDVVVVKSGIGKVNSAVCTTILVEKYKVEKVIFTGVSGGVNQKLEVGDIVVSKDLVQHDFDCTAFGAKPGEIPRMKEYIFKADPELIDIAHESAKRLFPEKQVLIGRVASGDQFISSIKKIDYLKTEFNADCTEMEGAAVAQVCYLYNIPFIVIRAISDKADHSANVDFQKFAKESAINSKKIVLEILKNI